MSTIRPAGREDLDETAAMLNEHSRRLHEMDDVTPADLLQYWESPDVELGQDILVAEDNGAIVGYADIGLHGGHVWLDVRATDPESLPVPASLAARYRGPQGLQGRLAAGADAGLRSALLPHSPGPHPADSAARRRQTRTCAPPR